MEPNAWPVWIAGAQVAVTVIIGLVAWHRDRSSARKKDLECLMEANQSIGDRVTKLETGSISHDDLGKVYDRINEVSDQVSTLNGTTKGMKGTLDMIHDHLLNNGGKR